MFTIPFLFISPIALATSAAVFGLIVAVVLFRRIAIQPLVKISLATGTAALTIAAGQPVWNRPTHSAVLVMVDLSPSTRGATFRDRASLDFCIHQLLGDQPFQMLGFAEHNQLIADEKTLVDLPAERTIFSPPPADAILLFSDGQFELPNYAPPTFPVIDPALDLPSDAAVIELKQTDQHILATLNNTGTIRPLRWIGAVADHPTNTAGSFTQLATQTGSGEVTASVPPGDRWPENDSLTIFLAPPLEKQKWWIGDDAPVGWHHFTPAELPTDSNAFLQASVIALQNVSADLLSSNQQTYLTQYVRDLGGALVVVGGPRAFAAGGYQNTPLDQLSPLASSPPQPTLVWLLLIDASGSMAGEPWQIEASAITRLLPQLPPADPVSVGSFAQALSWWSTGKSAAESATISLPPPNLAPHGPTNLSATLNEIVSESDGASPTQLLLITDADAELPQPTKVAELMKAKKIHLHLLAIGQGSALPALQSIASITGGSVIQQFDSHQWISGANLLLRSAMPNHYEHRIINLTPAPPESISQWNQTWLKPSAVSLQASGSIPTIASWQLGLGRVTAIAYPMETLTVDRYAGQIEQSPADPRLAVTWEIGAKLRIKVDASDHDQYMNGLPLNMEMRDPNANGSRPIIAPIPQVGPGKYELTVLSPRSPQLIRVKNADQVLRQFAVAGRYAPEFEAIGNNRNNLQLLAQRTGGRVLFPGSPLEAKPISFRKPTRQINVAPEIAFTGFIFLAVGLILYRKQS